MYTGICMTEGKLPSPCEGCAIKDENLERFEHVARFMSKAVESWWNGDLETTLQDVVMDGHAGPYMEKNVALNDEEFEVTMSCAAEHTSNRCANFIPDSVNL